MSHHIHDLTEEFSKGIYKYKDGTFFNLRWMEPPIIIYYITTMDEFGNKNVAPVSLGTYLADEYFAFSMVHEETGRDEKDKETAWHTSPRDTTYNLDKNGECVISYATKRQLLQVRIAGCPLPTGIDEGEVGGFTYYPSMHVSVPCINECPVNMEAQVVFSKVFGRIKLFVCKIRAVHVDEYYEKLDREMEGDPGLILTDPIFEIYQQHEWLPTINEIDPKRDLRMKMATLGADSPLMQEHSKIGPRRRWLGTFEIWMEDELTLGTISQSEYDNIMALYESWKKDRNPETNGETKKELTAFIKEIIWKRNLKKEPTASM